jgi:hypothetical protein
VWLQQQQQLHLVLQWLRVVAVVLLAARHPQT